jgi:hypothetical protein
MLNAATLKICLGSTFMPVSLRRCAGRPRMALA